MEIKTAFNIGDLVQYKFSKNTALNEAVAAYQIMEVRSQTCYAGTKIAYELRALVAKASFAWDKPSGEKGKLPESIRVITYEPSLKTLLLREDEIKPCSKEVAHQIKEIQESESGQ